MRHSVGYGYAVRKTMAAQQIFNGDGATKIRRGASTKCDGAGSTAAAINSCSLLNADVPRAGGLDVEKNCR